MLRYNTKRIAQALIITLSAHAYAIEYVQEIINNSDYDLTLTNNHTHALTTSDNRTIPADGTFTIGKKTTVSFSDFRIPWLVGLVRRGQQIDLQSLGNPAQLRAAFGAAEGDIHLAVARKNTETVYYYLTAQRIRVIVHNDTIAIQSIDGTQMQGPLTAKNIDKGRYPSIK